MDVPRQSIPSRRRFILGACITLAVAVIGLGLARLKPAAPLVDRQGLLIDTVKRGEMIFQVRGIGTLVPVQVRLISAEVPCRVERVILQAGSEVRPESVIAELSSPEIQQAAEDAMWQMRQAEADYEIARLNQKAQFETAQSNARETKATLKAKEQLRQVGLESELELLRARVKEEDASGRLRTEEARMGLYETRDGRGAPARARLEQARALYALKREQAASLHVRAGMSGILQQMPLLVGQQLTPGASLAKVARALPLKAELKVAEVQAKDLQVGQAVEVDTRNGVIRGRIIRIDPAVLNGTVTVDVGLEGELPKGARPDLSVEAVIELERVVDGLFVGRPVLAQPRSALSLFKVNREGTEAGRVKVSFGRGSVSSMEILDGLRPGDQVILSDTSAWENVDRIRLR